MAYTVLSAASTAPGVDAVAVTTSDTVDLPRPPARALWVGTTGDVTVITAVGSTVTFVSVTGLLPIQATRVMATGTTATNIVAIY